MSTAIKKLLERIPGSPLHTVRQFKIDPVGTQRRLLRDLLTTAADTEWGRRYNFAEIAQADDVVAAYQENVPLHTYDDLREDAKRIREGEADIIWPGTIRHFAVSSGTVSDGKIIPITEEIIAENRKFSVGTGIHYFAKTGNYKILLGSHLTLPGRVSEDPEYPGTMAGEISGLLAEKAPGFFRALFQAVPNEVAFMPNWDEKLKRIAEETVDQDVRLLVMAPPWALVLFEELIDLYNERHNASATTVGEVWPNLQVFISGGVALQSYRDLLEDQIGKDIDFLETYGASEGFFSFQNELSDPAMLLHLDNGVFFEFVRQEEVDDENPKRYTIADVEPGVRYAPYLTNCSGLWAYQLGDVVRFTQTDPPKIEVAGRTSEMMDRYGEAVYGDETRDAIQHALEETDSHMTDFHVSPLEGSRDEPPRHEWLIEFEPGHEPDDLEAFGQIIDDYLQSVNRHYQIRREARAFDLPKIVALPEGSFYAWLQEEKDEISGQTKVPRTSEERDVADRVLAIVGNNRKRSS